MTIRKQPQTPFAIAFVLFTTVALGAPLTARSQQPAQGPAVAAPAAAGVKPAVIPKLAAPSAAAAKEKAPAPAQAAAPAGDPYGFTAWLNATRAAYGLAPVGYDPNLSAWANVNNGRQQSYGMGHHVMGPARRQNAAMCSGCAQACQMWMLSAGHRAALLDPTIRWIGIASLGAYWTFNGN